MRRQSAGGAQDTKRVRQAELLADQAECLLRIKRIRGSFDIFALEGKEELMVALFSLDKIDISLDTWPDANHASFRSQWNVQGCAKPGDSEISPVLATYDGESRLQFDDVLE
ncbi:hypothetical protein IW142_003160 [Coemansia sp. RSA 564]|nr:hypothetical protein IW142_003160 [Coemansia sp. RSA 564]KAJ2191479.1 hypothetical protein EV181_000301 [Coemansia sp. RSA 532]